MTSYLGPRQIDAAQESTRTRETRQSGVGETSTSAHIELSQVRTVDRETGDCLVRNERASPQEHNLEAGTMGREREQAR